MRSRKKYFLLFLMIIFITIPLVSCDIDPYVGKRPNDYINSKWLCYKYNMSFEVNSSGEIVQSYMNTNGQSIPVRYLWAQYNPSVNIYYTVNGEESLLFSGRCEFHSNHFTVYDNDGSNSDSFIQDEFIEFQRLS